MDRSIFISIGNLQIKWYSICLLIGMGIGSILVLKEFNKKGLNKDQAIDIIFYSLLLGIIGARIYYVIFNWSYYSKYPLEIGMVWNGGLAIHGGLIAGLLFLLFISKKKNINILLLLDCIVVGLIIAQSIGRWGNFFNGEAYGRVVSLSFLKSLHLPKFIIDGMYINNEYREPTFLYESIASLIGFIVLIIIRKKNNLKIGQLTGLYLTWYGIERLIIESFRSDSLMLSSLKIAQIISIIFIVCGVSLLGINSKKEKYYKEGKIV